MRFYSLKDIDIVFLILDEFCDMKNGPSFILCYFNMELMCSSFQRYN